MPNDFQAIADTLTARGARQLRENSIMLRLVSGDIETAAKSKNDTINVPLPPTITVGDVTPGAAPVAAPSVKREKVGIKLDQWKKAEFDLTDKEAMEIPNERILPAGSAAALKALANFIDSWVIGKLYKRSFAARQWGTPVVISDFTQSGKLLDDNLAPMDEARSLVLDTTLSAEAEAMSVFHEAQKVGDQGQALATRSLGTKFGFGISKDQNVTTAHTAGTATDFLVNDPGAALALGDKSVPVDSVGGGTHKEGDLITFAGDSQVYVVTADLTLGGGGSGNTTIEPGLKAIPANNAAVGNPVATHTVRALAFHKDAFVFGSRPLAEVRHPASIISEATDPLSGVSLRLEVTRQTSQTKWQYDVLFGGEVVLPALIARGYR